MDELQIDGVQEQSVGQTERQVAQLLRCIADGFISNISFVIGRNRATQTTTVEREQATQTGNVSRPSAMVFPRPLRQSLAETESAASILEEQIRQRLGLSSSIPSASTTSVFGAPRLGRGALLLQSLQSDWHGPGTQAQTQAAPQLSLIPPPSFLQPAAASASAAAGSLTLEGVNFDTHVDFHDFEGFMRDGSEDEWFD